MLATDNLFDSSLDPAMKVEMLFEKGDHEPSSWRQLRNNLILGKR